MEEYRYQCDNCGHKYNRPIKIKRKYSIPTGFGSYETEGVFNCCPNCETWGSFTALESDGTTKYWMSGGSAMGIPNLFGKKPHFDKDET